MIIRSKLARTAVALVTSAGIAFASVNAQAETKPAAANGEFDGVNFTCLNYTNGLGESSTGKAQSMLARVWIEGYLAGYLKGKDKLVISDAKGDDDHLQNVMLQKCREYAGSSILAVSQQAIAADEPKMPANVLGDFSINAYTCGQHTEAKKAGAAGANKTDVAELWAFAFIQGFKNVDAPQMVISMENKGALVGAIAHACEKSPDMKYMDLAALVAAKVKLQ